MHNPKLSQEYLDYIQSPLWRHQRLRALQRWGRKCNACGRGSSIEVHHLTYKNLHDVTSMDLMPLCCSCHDACHEEGTLKTRLSFCSDVYQKRQAIIAYFNPNRRAKTSKKKKKNKNGSKVTVVIQAPIYIPSVAELAKIADETRLLETAKKLKHEHQSQKDRERSDIRKRANIVALGLATEEEAKTLSSKAMSGRLKRARKAKKKAHGEFMSAIWSKVRDNPGQKHYKLW